VINGFTIAMQVKVTGERVLKRIKKLVIPPNWRDTFISRDSKASVQAVGYDEKGRKQYIYHNKWHEQQQVEKFERLVAFGNALPEFREHCLSLISQPTWTRKSLRAGVPVARLHKC